jgi:hypothetical protein
MSRSSLEQSLLNVRQGLDIFVLVGGTLFRDNSAALVRCGGRGVAIRVLFPAQRSPWLREYVQSAGASLDDYLGRIRGNAGLARRLVPGAQVRYHCSPVPAWFVLFDRAAVATKPVAFYSAPAIEFTTEPVLLAKLSQQFDRVWADATEDEAGPTVPGADPVEPLLLLVERISDEWRDLREGIHRALRIADADPEMALARTRKVLDLLLRDVYQRRLNQPAGTRPLENLIQQLVKEGCFPARLEAYATAVRLLGNVGVHRFEQDVGPADVNRALLQLLPILEWFFAVERPDGLTPRRDR